MSNKRILVFGASNSKHSINKKLATYAASKIENININLLDLNDFEMPIYCIDDEKETGIPALAIEFKKHIEEADGIIVSFAEHNSTYSAAFKNIFDWISRLEGSVWGDKPMLLMATSPGGRGGKSVLDLASTSFKFMNKGEMFSFSLPKFNEHFSEPDGITNQELSEEFNRQLGAFKEACQL